MIMRRISDFICRICPLSMILRKYPQSKLARAIESIICFCPFCKADKSEPEKEGKKVGDKDR